MSQNATCDLAIIGGGLAGGLIALAARRAHPDRNILLVEARPSLGGNHLWTFLDSDIDKRDRPLLQHLVTYGWRNFEVIFPSWRRTIDNGLYSIRSDLFDQALRDILPGGAILSGRAAVALGPTTVDFEDGTHIDAGGVIDARGAADLTFIDPAWRTFVGYELQLAGPHSVRHARLIEAGEEQDDGLAFMTLLPLEADKLFVEEVRFGIDPHLELPDFARRIFNLAARFGWRITDSARGHAGVVPITMGGDFDAYWQSGGAGVAKAGIRAGLFHPVTGASLADAVRVAQIVAGLSDWSGEALHKALHDHATRTWKRRDFYRRFTRQMLHGTPLPEQYRMLEALYARDDDLVGRFHRADLTLTDRLTLSIGDGPMPFSSLLRGKDD